MKINKIVNKVLKNKPKKFILKRERATVVLPTKPAKPVLRRSEVFKGEWEKEKNILSWK